MSELYSDSSRFARDLDAWITRDDRPECEDEPDSIVCDTCGCTATHPDCESAHEDGWLIEAGDADNDPVRLCPKCKSGQTAAERAAFDAAYERLCRAQDERGFWHVSLVRVRDSSGVEGAEGAWMEPPHWHARIDLKCGEGFSTHESVDTSPGQVVTNVLAIFGA